MDTKQLIFNAAVDLFSLKGYHNVSVREIAEKVGIKPASIYNHYASKEAILADIFDFYAQIRGNTFPDINDILEFVGRENPRDTFMRTAFSYPKESNVIMVKIMLISNMLNKTNARAEEILKELFFSVDSYDRPILGKMLEMDLIEPLDVNRFISVHSNYLCCTAAMFMLNLSIQKTDFFGDVKLIAQLIKPKGEYAEQ